MSEIKFYSDEFTVSKDYHFVLERRKRLLSEVIPKKATVYNTLITTYGLRRNEYSGDFTTILFTSVLLNICIFSKILCI